MFPHKVLVILVVCACGISSQDLQQDAENLCKTLHKGSQSLIAVQGYDPCRFDCYVEDIKKSYQREDGAACANNKKCKKGLCQGPDTKADDICRRYFNSGAAVGMRSLEQLCMTECFDTETKARVQIPMPNRELCRSGSFAGTCTDGICVI